MRPVPLDMLPPELQGEVKPANAVPLDMLPPELGGVQAKIGETSNPFAGMVGRAAEFTGFGLEAIAEVGSRSAKKISSVAAPENETPKQKQVREEAFKFELADPLFKWARSLKGFNKEIGYQPTTKLKDLADNPLTAVPFIVERVITSAPDMAAAMVNLPAYIGARTKEILDERVKNDNKTLDDATVADVTAAATAAIVEGTLERFATGRLFKGAKTGKTGIGRVGKETAIQSGTEFAEEVGAYLGETAGTVKGVDRQELIERGIEGAIVGGGLGGGVQTTKEVLGRKKPTEAKGEPVPEENLPQDIRAPEVAPEERPAEPAAVDTEEYPFPPGMEPEQVLAPETAPAEPEVAAPAITPEVAPEAAPVVAPETAAIELEPMVEPVQVEPIAPMEIAPLERPELRAPEFLQTRPVEQEPLPIPEEIERTEADIQREEKRAEALEQVKPTKDTSLYEFFAYRPKRDKTKDGVIDNRLDMAEVFDLSPDRTFNFIRKKGGKRVSDFVASQQMNPWLPFELRIDGTETADQLSEKEPAAEEYIKDLLRNRDYLTYETKLELERIGESIESLERALEQDLGRYATDEAKRQEINDLLAEINAELEQEFPPAETLEAPPTGAERGAGEPTGPLRAEEPAEDLTKPQTRIVYRAGSSGLASMSKNVTAQDIIDYERDELGNEDVTPVQGKDLKSIPANQLEWVTFDRESAKEYVNLEAPKEYRAKITSKKSTFEVIATDGDGGYLIRPLKAEEISPEDKRRADMERDLFRLTPEEGGIAPTTGVQGDMFGATGLMAPTPQLQRRKNANTQQLSLFLDSEPDESQPGSDKARKAAVEAVEQLQESNNPMAMSLADEFAHQQVALLVGKKVKSIEDMAFLAQVYRDNRFETFRVFFTDAKGDIVSQLGITSRMPASTSVSIGDNVSEYFNSVLDVAKTKGATGYYLVHNHPSGRVQASAADRQVSFVYAQRFKQLEYKGHIIIDTNKYGVVNADGTYYEKAKDFGEKPFPGQEGEMGVIKSLEDVAAYTKQMELKENDIVLVATNIMGNVTQVSTVPSTIVTPGNKPRLRRALQKITLKGNASDLVVVGRNRDQLIPFVGLVKDVVFIDKNGTPNSMVYVGRKVLGGERPGRVAAGTSPEFNYLKEAKNRKPASMKTTEAIEKDNPNVYPTRKNIFGQPVEASWGRQDESKFDTFLHILQDKMVDTKRVIEQIRKSGKEISDRWNPYLKEELFHGRSAKKTKDFLMTELDPLMVDMRNRGVEMAEFEEYLHNRTAKERNALVAKRDPDRFPDGGSGLLDAEADAYMAGLDPKKKADFEALAKRIDAITKGTRDLLVKSGHETKETIEAWEKALPNYVPLNRAEADYELQNMGTGVGQGFAVRGKFSRAAVGSERAVVNILANIAMQRERAIVRTEKMRVAQALYGLVLQNPNPGFWLAVDPEAQANPKDIEGIAKTLVSMGFNANSPEVTSLTDLAKSIMEQPTIRRVNDATNQVVNRANLAMVNSPFALPVRINGTDKYVFFNPNDPLAARMAKSLRNVDADQMDKVLGPIAKVTRYFAAINTQYNPIFGVINFMRDVQGALIQLSSTPLAGKQKEVAAQTMPALRGIYADLRANREGKSAKGEWAKLWNQFQQLGGQTGFRDQFSRSEERADALYSVMNPDSWAETKLGKIFTVNGTLKVPLEVARKSVAKPLFDWLSDYNETMENAIRLSAFKTGLDSGLTPDQAASVAKNLTVNFNRKGLIGKQVGALYAFFNASVQGTARMASTLFTKKDGKISLTSMGKKIFYGGLLLGSAQAMLLAAAGFDEDEPPEFVKERNLIIPIGGGKYVTIPYPLGYNVVPNTGRILTEWAMSGFQNTPKRIASLTGAYLEMFNPIGNAGWSMQTFMPTIVDIPMALAENKDWTGKPIAKEDFSSLDPTPGYTRARDTASWFSKNLSEFLNLASGGTAYQKGIISPTPDQIDYLIGQLTGGVGRELMKAEQMARATATGEDLPPYKIPLVGRFYGDTKGQAATRNQFYNNLIELNGHQREVKGLRKEGASIPQYYAKYPEARLAKMADNIERNVSRLRKRREQLLEKDAPKEQIKAIEDQITRQMERLNAAVKKAKEK